MSSPYKKFPETKSGGQWLKSQAGGTQQFKPVVAQLKSAATSPNARRPIAPPVYRPQATAKAVQPKMANGALNRKPPIAPPVYRPQQVPKVLQTKSAPAQRPQAGQAPRQAVAPPVYRPEVKKIVQPKAISQHHESPTAPPAYSSERTRIAQPRMAAALTRPGQNEIRALVRLPSNSVVQRMEQQKIEVDFDEPSPEVNVLRYCNYHTIKGQDVWNNIELLTQHCFTYCKTEKLVWIKFAYVVGAPPPELGHGSELEKVTTTQKGKKSKGNRGGKKEGGSKDEIRWNKFQQSMGLILNAYHKDVKGNTDFKKAEKVVNEYGGVTPEWW